MDALDQRVAASAGGIGVALGVRVLTAVKGRIGHERPNSGVVGVVVIRQELLVEDGQLGTSAHEPGPDLAELPFQ